MKAGNSKERRFTEYDRHMARSMFVSLFWNIIAFKKKHGGFSLKTLASKIGVNKSSPSRWFSSKQPNWTIDTIADIASALDVDIEIRARDRTTGTVFMASGPARNRPIEKG
jgi:hypothetical protein